MSRGLFYSVARAALFQLEPERAHDLALSSLSRLQRLGLIRTAAAAPRRLPTQVMGIEFPNPIGLAAGLDKNGDHLLALSALGFGFVEIGTTTPRPQTGNPQPRMFRLPRQNALINRLGFNNKGVEYLVDRVKRTKFDGVLGINIGKNKDTPNEKAVDDYLFCLERVYPFADYITVNVSSPNTPGLRDLQHESALQDLLDALAARREALATEHGRQVPYVLKIAPDLDPVGIESTARVLNDSNVDGVIATNTTITRPAVDQEPNAAEAGGLSGAPLLSLANDVLRQFRGALEDRIALIGVGGVVASGDALEKRRCGADLVQIYTGLIYQGPHLIDASVKAWARASGDG